MTYDFHVGDWVFCEFELGQIAEMEDGRVTNFATEHGSLGSYDLTDRCVPLTMPMKRIASTFEWHSRKLHDHGSPGLNYPAIHRWLVDLWVKTCAHADDLEAVRGALQTLQDFTNEMLSAPPMTPYGFALMRPR